MRYNILLALLVLNLLTHGQIIKYPEINEVGKTIEDFVPSNWTILSKSTGDLNKDSLIDYALVLQCTDTSFIITNVDMGVDTINSNPRILLILFKQKDNNSFVLRQRSNTFILRHTDPMMDDPFEDLEILNGVLNINFRIWYNAGSWSIVNASYKFRYQNNDFCLIGADLNSYMRNSGDYTDFSYNFLSKKMSITTGNEFDETSKSTTDWKSLNIKTLKTLKSFIEPFTWNEDSISL